MARKKKKTSLRPAPFLVLFLLVNMVAGLIGSRMTVIRKVEVTGVQDWDKPRIEGIVGQLKGRPCALIDRYWVESMALQDPSVRTASFDRNLFGSAVLNLTYQTPAARFYNHAHMGLSSEGVVYWSAHLPPSLPTVQLTDGENHALITFSALFPSAEIARVAQRVSAEFPNKEVRIEYGTGSSLCLNMGTGRVILGSTDDLESKLEKLRERLVRNPNYWTNVKSLNLLDPKNPMTVPK